MIIYDHNYYNYKLPPGTRKRIIGKKDIIDVLINALKEYHGNDRVIKSEVDNRDKKKLIIGIVLDFIFEKLGFGIINDINRKDFNKNVPVAEKSKRLKMLILLITIIEKMFSENDELIEFSKQNKKELLSKLSQLKEQYIEEVGKVNIMPEPPKITKPKIKKIKNHPHERKITPGSIEDILIQLKNGGDPITIATRIYSDASINRNNKIKSLRKILLAYYKYVDFLLDNPELSDENSEDINTKALKIEKKIEELINEL